MTGIAKGSFGGYQKAYRIHLPSTTFWLRSMRSQRGPGWSMETMLKNGQLRRTRIFGYMEMVIMHCIHVLVLVLTESSWSRKIHLMVCTSDFADMREANETFNSSTVISHIQEKYKDEPNAVIVYWYFTFRDLTSQKVDNLLRMLVTNLCSKLTTLPKPILEAYSQANNGQLLPSSRSLMHMLEVLLDEYEDVYIVLDALDECPKAGLDQERQRDELLQRICELYCWEKESLHILTTSRTEPDIEETVMGLSDSPGTFKTVDVQGTHVQEDIKKYIRHKLGDRRFVKWTTSLKTEVETTLVSQANGM
jgi:hypothetical protein